MKNTLVERTAARDFLVQSLLARAEKEGIDISAHDKDVMLGLASDFETPEYEAAFERKVASLLKHVADNDPDKFKDACNSVAKEDDHMAFLVQEYVTPSTRSGSLKDAFQLLLTAVVVVVALALISGGIVAVLHFVHR